MPETGSPTAVSMEAIATLLDPIRQSVLNLEQSVLQTSGSVLRLEKNVSRLEKNVSLLGKSVSRLEQTSGILVEEKARAKARAMFGINFSKSLLIRSIHDVVKHIAKADDKKLPAENGDLQINAAVEKVAGVAQHYAGTFVRSALLSLKKVAADTVFDDDKFAECKQELTNLDKLLSTKDPDFGVICGKMIKIVLQLGNTSRIGGETEEQMNERIKMATGRFQRKLNRLKFGFKTDTEKKEQNKLATEFIQRKLETDEDNEDKKKNIVLATARFQELEDFDNLINYANCSGPGIMICCELSQIMDQGQPSVEKIRDISEWKEEVECDIRGSVSLIDKHATISTGEIKTSAKEYKKATKQIELRVALIEYILQLALEEEGNNKEEKRFTNVIKKGHVFVLGKDNSNQRGVARESSRNVSMFYHNTDIGEH